MKYKKIMFTKYINEILINYYTDKKTGTQSFKIIFNYLQKTDTRSLSEFFGDCK